MEIKDLTTVTITEKDLCQLIEEFLCDNNLVPDNPIKSISVGNEQVGYGQSESYSPYIKDTVIKCSKIVK